MKQRVLLHGLHGLPRKNTMVNKPNSTLFIATVVGFRFALKLFFSIFLNVVDSSPIVENDETFDKSTIFIHKMQVDKRCIETKKF